VDSASGIHPRHSPYYIRSVRADNKDPLTTFMKEMAYRMNQKSINRIKQRYSISRSGPLKGVSPVANLEQLIISSSGNASKKNGVNISRVVRSTSKKKNGHEVGGWVYDNFDILSGISFLPFEDHSYQQAPYQEISQSEYEAFVLRMPKEIAWEDLKYYEKEDSTIGSSQLACSGDSCEVVDLTR
jgi:ribonucleoside-triphosphate reductase